MAVIGLAGLPQDLPEGAPGPAGCLDGWHWLAGWLAGLAGWLAGRIAGWQGWLAGPQRWVELAQVCPERLSIALPNPEQTDVSEITATL